MIDPVAFEEFKKTLPEDIQNEHFRWLGTHYSIPKALFLIKTQNLEKGHVTVASWCKALGMDGEKKVGDEHKFSFNMLTGVMDEDALKDNINPDIPIIIVQHTFKVKRKKEMTNLVIDGNKRLRKAFLSGRQTVDAYLLPEKLAKLTRDA